MPIYYGGSKISEIYNGGTKIKEVYNGESKVFSSDKTLKYCVATYTQSWAPDLTFSMNSVIFPNIQTSTTYLSLHKYSGSAYNGYILSDYKPLVSITASLVDVVHIAYYVKTVNINGIDFELYRETFYTPVVGNVYTRFYLPKGFVLNQSVILYHYDKNLDEDYYTMDSRTSTSFIGEGNTYTITHTEEIDVLTGESK